MNHQTSITIAICTYNRADYLRDTLRDLSAQTASLNAYEVLVIDNNCSDHTQEVCSRFQSLYPDIKFRYAQEARQGLSYARNRVLEEANSNSILYIDDDVRLPAHFVETSLRYLEQYPDVKCAGGRIFVEFDGAEPDWIPEELMPMFGLHDLGDRDKRYPATNFPRGGNMFIKKDLFEEVGHFDTGLGRIGKKLLGSEEKAFFDRARNAGYELHYWANLELYHRIGLNRLQEKYLKEQSEGIGYSEQIRLRNSAAKKVIKLGSELVKFVGSILLGAGYLLKGNRKAAVFMLKFRIWVLKGFLKRHG